MGALLDSQIDGKFVLLRGRGLPVPSASNHVVGDVYVDMLFSFSTSFFRLFETFLSVRNVKLAKHARGFFS